MTAFVLCSCGAEWSGEWPNGPHPADREGHAEHFMTAYVYRPAPQLLEDEFGQARKHIRTYQAALDESRMDIAALVDEAEAVAKELRELAAGGQRQHGVPIAILEQLADRLSPTMAVPSSSPCLSTQRKDRA